MIAASSVWPSSGFQNHAGPRRREGWLDNALADFYPLKCPSRCPDLDADLSRPPATPSWPCATLSKPCATPSLA